jgi:hypothetical protein
MRDEAGIRRPILVDDLEGTAHRDYGLLPNMTWVTGRGGQILIEYRDVDRPAFYDHLRRMGPSSYQEFRNAERLWDELD